MDDSAQNAQLTCMATKGLCLVVFQMWFAAGDLGNQGCKVSKLQTLSPGSSNSDWLSEE